MTIAAMTSDVERDRGRDDERGARPTAWSARPELVGLLDEPEVGECLRVPDPVDRLEPLGQEAEEPLVVLRHGLDEDVEPARRHDDVVHLGKLRERLGHRDEAARLAANPDQRLLEPELAGIGDADDLEECRAR